MKLNTIMENTPQHIVIVFTGFEFVYIKADKNNRKVLLFENKMAKHGIWLNDKQIAGIAEEYFMGLRLANGLGDAKDLINVNDVLIIESYKNRANYKYNESGTLDYTPDFYRELKIIDLPNK